MLPRSDCIASVLRSLTTDLSCNGLEKLVCSSLFSYGPFCIFSADLDDHVAPQLSSKLLLVTSASQAIPFFHLTFVSTQVSIQRWIPNSNNLQRT